MRSAVGHYCHTPPSGESAGHASFRRGTGSGIDSAYAGGQTAGVFSIHTELQALATRLHAEDVPYGLCGALALAVHGFPRATLDIDLLALSGSGSRILRCARACGFTLEAAPRQFAAGSIRIERLSKAVAGIEDVLMLDVLSLSAEIEGEIRVETVEWEGVSLPTVSRESLVRLKRLRGSAQDMADIEKLL